MNLVKFRKVGNPILSASKAISFAGALMSVLALQTAMISRFGEGDEYFRMKMNIITGSCHISLCPSLLLEDRTSDLHILPKSFLHLSDLYNIHKTSHKSLLCNSITSHSPFTSLTSFAPVPNANCGILRCLKKHRILGSSERFFRRLDIRKAVCDC